MKQLRYNGPAAVGVRPGHPFSFTLPVTGCRSVGLAEIPAGAEKVAFKDRRITGKLEEPGRYVFGFRAEGPAGELPFAVEFRCGEEIALTPPMGWNSWYCFSESVSDRKIREAARGMVDRGLAAHGWNFIDIDDCWEGERGGRYGALQGNERFPDMAGLAEYVHSLGLRFGIYSTPWIGTYAGFRGGSIDPALGEAAALPPEKRLQPGQLYGRYPAGEAKGVFRLGERWLLDADIRQWAEWGVDLVKMDWQPNDVATTARLARALRECGRDIILSLSNNAPFEHAAPLSGLAQMWRISGDISDSWETVGKIGFELSRRWLPYSRPGHWNDLDMLQIGALGVPNSYNTVYCPTRLTREEQRTQLTLWCMLSAPLFLSCDLAGMDQWTYELLTNDAVLAVDQDPLAAPPRISELSAALRLYRKPLADGSEALAVFNLADTAQHWDSGAAAADAEQVLELWSGLPFSGGMQLLAPHGCLLLRLR